MENDKLRKQNINLLWSGLVLEALRQMGVENFFVSSGMRNIPFLHALSQAPWANVHVGIDERASAFLALGFVRATKKLVVLNCTSGTAVANYLPAVIEAYHERLPLILLTADRSEELLDADFDQTIDQRNIFSSFVQECYSMPAPNSRIDPQVFLSKFGQLYFQLQENQLPVQINIPFFEPFLAPTNNLDPSYVLKCETFFSQNQIIPRYQKSKSEISSDFLRGLLDQLCGARRLLIVVGKDTELDADHLAILQNFLECFPALIKLDVTSSLKLKRRRLKGEIAAWDHPANRQFFQEETPDMVLHLGRRLISRHFYQYLKDLPPFRFVTINSDSRRTDPSMRMQEKIVANFWPILSMLIQFRKEEGPATEALNWVKSYEEKVVNTFSPRLHHLLFDSSFGKKIKHSDVVVALSEKLKGDEVLFLATSLSIRLFEIYGGFLNFASCPAVYTQRGANGLEGMIANPVGIAMGLENKTVVAVIGDMGFLYDLNSLILLKESKQKIVIIVVNNDGGGIFVKHPISEYFSHLKSQYITVPHGLQNFKPLADQFSLDFFHVTERSELEVQLNLALNSPKSVLFEVKIDWDEDLCFTKAWNC